MADGDLQARMNVVHEAGIVPLGVV
jgi:hypothetical protein